MNPDPTQLLRESVNRIPPHRRLSSTQTITNRRGKQLLKDLETLQDGEGDILWVVNSDGGLKDLEVGIALHGAFARSVHRVIGLVTGKAGSNAFMALQGCRLRLATPSSFLQIHNPTWVNLEVCIRFDTSDGGFIEQQRAWFREWHPKAVEGRELVVNLLLQRSGGLDRDALTAILEAAKSMTADEAIALGLLDAVYAQEPTQDQEKGDSGEAARRAPDGN
jgi:ATP-dependent protease ClpP protease subunit